MTASLHRARLRPGPFLVCAFIAVTASAVRAHDPGLSTLDVVVDGQQISATLAMSAADVAIAVPSSHADLRDGLRHVVRESVHVTVDENELAPVSNEVVKVDGGGRVRMSYELPIAIGSSPRRFTIASDIPKRLARGHRELLTITNDRRSAIERVLDATSDPVAFEMAAPSQWASRAFSFVRLGIQHILTGYDHLVFLAGLILAATTMRQLLVALTAFTAAHSVSLALVVVAGVHAPSSIVEPLIAASIAWVGVENLLRRRQGTRWIVVFGFGLIHGFGFADALIELGFGTSLVDVATALVSFNGGVEIGQLAAAATMLPVVWTINARPAWQRRLVPACSMLITLAGGYWLLERIS
jgi:hydrogenase/urease accessory protein HupE